MPLVDMGAADWDRILRINLDSVFYGIKHGARAIKGHGEGGTIINTASLAALTARSDPGSYSVAKAAIVNLTMTAAGNWLRTAFASTPSRRAGSSPASS